MDLRELRKGLLLSEGGRGAVHKVGRHISPTHINFNAIDLWPPFLRLDDYAVACYRIGMVRANVDKPAGVNK
jgi:hypothetical protein